MRGGYCRAGYIANMGGRAMLNNTDFEKYIQPELLVVVAVLYFLGMGLKTSAVNDKYIPVILGVAGVLMATLYTVAAVGFSAMAVFTGITQGIICAGVAVYVNQIIKQAKK